jgi:hypothetical protein
MTNQYVRMMLLQLFLVFLVILWVGFSLKTRLTPLPATAFPVLLRSYGILLLIFPATWCIWAIIQSRRPAHDTRDELIIGISGVALCVAILLLGWFASRAAWSAPVFLSTPQKAPPSTPQLTK